MIQTRSRERIREHAEVSELVSHKEEVRIGRRKKQTCSSNDFVLSPEAEERIRLSREQYHKGEFTSCRNAEEAVKFLESL